MEKKPFTPAQEPEIPQYVMSVSDRRARNQDGTFISNEAVQTAHETYDTQKAAYDEQEADRLRVYENAASLPEDTDVSKLTASDLQEKLGITYKQALELQDAGGNGARDLIQAAREWKAEQPEAAGEAAKTVPEEADGLLEELPEFIQETVVPNTETSDKKELTAKEMDTVLRSLISDYRKADANGARSEELSDYRTKIESAFNALKVKDGWTEDETEVRRSLLTSFLGGQETQAAATETVEKEAEKSVEENANEASDHEPDAEQLDRNLRGLVSNYRRTKDSLKPEEVDEAQEEIFAAFEQLQAKTGWTGVELDKRRGQLFELMGRKQTTGFKPTVTPEAQAVYDRIDAEAAEGKVEELVAVKGNKVLNIEETMDALISKMGGSAVEHSSGTTDPVEETDNRYNEDAMEAYIKADFDTPAEKTPRQGFLKRFFAGRRNKQKTAPKTPFRTVTTGPAVRSKGVRINAERARDLVNKDKVA